MIEENKEGLKKMTLGEHLEELRSRLIKSVIVVFICILCCFYFNKEILNILIKPHKDALKLTNLPADKPLIITRYTEVFVNSLKVAFIGGVFISAPFWILQMWLFISAGLYPNERKKVIFFILFSLLLFVLGISFGFFVIIPIVLRFFLQFSTGVVEPLIKLDDYISTIFQFCFWSGIIFQLPLVMMFLSKFGIVSPQTFISKWRIAVVIVFIIAALATPPDPISQSILGVPMVGLYFLGIILAKMATRKASQ